MPKQEEILQVQFVFGKAERDLKEIQEKSEEVRRTRADMERSGLKQKREKSREEKKAVEARPGGVVGAVGRVRGRARIGLARILTIGALIGAAEEILRKVLVPAIKGALEPVIRGLPIPGIIADQLVAISNKVASENAAITSKIMNALPALIETYTQGKAVARATALMGTLPNPADAISVSKAIFEANFAKRVLKDSFEQAEITTMMRVITEAALEKIF